MKKSFLSAPTANEIIIVIIVTIIGINVLAFAILAQDWVKIATIVGNLIVLVLFVFYVKNNRKKNRTRRSNNSSNHSSGNPSETGNSSSSNLDTTTTKTNEDRLSSEQLRHLSAPITQEYLSKYLQEYLPKYLQEHLPKYLEVLKKEDVTQDEKIYELESTVIEKNEKIRELEYIIIEKDKKIHELEDIINGPDPMPQDDKKEWEKLVDKFNERNKDHFTHLNPQPQFLKLNDQSIHGKPSTTGSTIVQLVSSTESEASYLKIEVDRENWLFPNLNSNRFKHIMDNLKPSIFTGGNSLNNPQLKKPAKLKDAGSGVWEIEEPGEFTQEQ